MDELGSQSLLTRARRSQRNHIFSKAKILLSAFIKNFVLLLPEIINIMTVIYLTSQKLRSPKVRHCTRTDRLPDEERHFIPIYSFKYCEVSILSMLMVSSTDSKIGKISGSKIIYQSVVTLRHHLFTCYCFA